MKKPKIKYEESTLNFRVPNELKLKVVAKANEQNITVSNYLRQVLEDAHDGTLQRKVENEKQQPTFLSSIEFLKLIVWIYQKKENNKLMEPIEQLMR
jgi:hypothetical protein